MMKKGDRIELEMWNSKTQASDWLPGIFQKKVVGDLGDDFDRFNVILDDGREFLEVHPLCVRKKVEIKE